MKTKHLLINLMLLVALLLGACGSKPRVGELKTESQSVELVGGDPVHVMMDLGFGDLVVTGDAKKLLEADFTYNVAELKPEVEYTDDTLIIRQPDTEGMPDLQNITDFRNEWDLRLKDDVAMDLTVGLGAGTSDLQLAGLSLTGLDITLGAGKSTIDLSGNWVNDLDVSMDTGAAEVTLRLPDDVGVRVEVDAGLSRIHAPSLSKNGNVYTNTAYGVSAVTLEIYMQVGIGQINLEVVDDHAQANAELQNLLDERFEVQKTLGMLMPVRLADGTLIPIRSGFTRPSKADRWSAVTPSLISGITGTFTLKYSWISHGSVSTSCGTGGIVSSASDLMIFACALSDGRVGSKDLMSQPVGIGNGEAWGLGGGAGGVADYRSFRKSGDDLGWPTLSARSMAGSV